MIRRIVAWLTANGVADLVLNLHHRPESLTAVVGDGGDLGARVRYSWEQPQVLGSGGGPRLALPILGVDTFLIVNGDTLTDVDISALAADHTRSGALVTLALIPNREFTRYGGVTLAPDGRIVGFIGRGPAAEGSYHFIGVQAASATAFASLRPGDSARSIGGAYDALMAAKPGSVRGFVSDASFWDVGTVTDYWRTSRAFAGLESAPLATPPSWIDPSATVARSILWNDVAIGQDADIEECIVTDGVRVPAGATYRRVVLVKREGLEQPAAWPFDVGTND